MRINKAITFEGATLEDLTDKINSFLEKESDDSLMIRHIKILKEKSAIKALILYSRWHD